MVAHDTSIEVMWTGIRRIGTDFDEVEGTVGRLPLSLRAFAERVGQVNLNGHLPGWDVPIPDPIVVEITIDYWLSEYQDRVQDQGTEWQYPGPYIAEITPGRFHMAGISGGAPYGLAVPNAAVDGLLIGEHHQTTFVNHLRISLAHAGMGASTTQTSRPFYLATSASWPQSRSLSDTRGGLVDARAR